MAKNMQARRVQSRKAVFVRSYPKYKRGGTRFKCVVNYEKNQNCMYSWSCYGR